MPDEQTAAVDPNVTQPSSTVDPSADVVQESQTAAAPEVDQVSLVHEGNATVASDPNMPTDADIRSPEDAADFIVAKVNAAIPKGLGRSQRACIETAIRDAVAELAGHSTD